MLMLNVVNGEKEEDDATFALRNQVINNRSVINSEADTIPAQGIMDIWPLRSRIAGI